MSCFIMDNASKALIMAGAVLIAVILVSLGMLLISSGQTQVEDAINMSDANAVAAYNNQFLQFQGEQRGTAVIQLINRAISSNEKHIETVQVNSGEADAADINGITRNAKYDVTFQYDGGLISNIIIEAAS